MGGMGGTCTAQSGVLFLLCSKCMQHVHTSYSATVFLVIILPVHRIQHELSVVFAQSSLTWSPM